MLSMSEVRHQPRRGLCVRSKSPHGIQRKYSKSLIGDPLNASHYMAASRNTAYCIMQIYDNCPVARRPAVQPGGEKLT